MDEIMKDLELLTDVTELEKEIEGEENNVNFHPSIRIPPLFLEMSCN